MNLGSSTSSAASAVILAMPTESFVAFHNLRVEDHRRAVNSAKTPVKRTKRESLISQKPPLGEADDALTPDHQMVEDADVDKLKGLFEPLRERFVRAAGFGVARGVVVHQDYRRGIMGQGALHDFARVDGGAVDGAAKQLLEGERAMAIVEEECAEDFVLKSRESRTQEVLGIARGAKYLADHTGRKKFSGGVEHLVCLSRPVPAQTVAHVEEI